LANVVLNIFIFGSNGFDYANAIPNGTRYFVVIVTLVCWAGVLFSLIGAIGLFRMQNWGRPVSIIAAIVALLNGTAFPVGTAIGIWTLVVILNARNTAAYKELCSRKGGREIPAFSPKIRADPPPESDIQPPSIEPETPPAYCSQCGCKLGMPGRFCGNCGSPTAPGFPNPMGPTSQPGSAGPFTGAQDTSIRAQLQQAESHSLARRELIIAAVLALIGWRMLANREEFAFRTSASSQELAWFQFIGMALVVAAVVLGVRGGSRYRG
jgi:hypothetical protein